MNARDLMTSNPACCTTDTPLHEVAHMMVECDCGEIPVVQRLDMKTPIGVVTDRDIVCRAVAQGRNPLDLTAGDVMTTPALTTGEGDHIDAIKDLMETRQIRRVPVVNQDGVLSGIVSLADLARCDSRQDTGEVVRQVSAPTR